MKTNFLFLFIMSLFIGFTSCSKEKQPDTKLQLAKKELSERSSFDDCRECTDLTLFEVNKISSDDTCCTYEIVVDINDPCVRLEVHIDGTLAFIASDNNLTHQFTVCDDQPHVVEVYGYDLAAQSWTDLCETITVNCKCGCRGKSPVTITQMLNTPNGCCLYNIQASSSLSRCEQSVRIGDQTYVLNNVSINVNKEVCEGEELIVQYLNGGVVCAADTLTCGCCEDITVEVEHLGAMGGGCCEFDVTVDNQSGCTQYIYGPTGNIVATIPNGTVFHQQIDQCYDGVNLSYTYRIGSSTDVICETFVLTAVCIEDCCEDVESTVTELGDIDGDGCCDYELTIINGEWCTKILYDGKGLVRATIAPGATYTTTFGSCLDKPWVGQWTLYNTTGDLCEEYDMGYKECEDCCEGVSITATLITVGPDGCCTYNVTAVNNGDCDIIFFDESDWIVPIASGGTFSVQLKACQNASNSYYVGKEFDRETACNKVTLTCD